MYSFSVCLAGLVAVFTGLYWWDTRRSFLLELDRVVLWYRLEQKRQSNIREVTEMIDKIAELPVNAKEDLKSHLLSDLAMREFSGEIAFFRTLKSKELQNRLTKYEEKQTEILSKMRKGGKADET